MLDIKTILSDPSSFLQAMKKRRFKWANFTLEELTLLKENLKELNRKVEEIQAEMKVKQMEFNKIATDKKKVLEILEKDKECRWYFISSIVYDSGLTRNIFLLQLKADIKENDTFYSNMKNTKELSRLFDSYEEASEWGAKRVKELETENPSEEGYLRYHIHAIPGNSSKKE